MSESLIEIGEVDKAEEILNLSFEKMPLDFFGYYTLSEPYIKTYYSLENYEKGYSLYEAIEKKYFDIKSPNTLRSILSGYVTRNSLFHSIDGSGYKYVANKIVEFDKSNPIVISRFLKIFSKYRQYENPYKKNIIKVLNYIKKNELSSNTREVIDAILN